MKRKSLVLVLILQLMWIPALLESSNQGSSAQYVGGTHEAIPDKSKGRFDLTAEDRAVFRSKRGSFEIPYQGIESLEYGQKAGRRVGMAIAVSPLALFSKKRKHYVTVGYVDDAGTRQGVVLEIPKGKVREVVTILEQRSGERVEFESEDAKKHFGN